jgi:hypothetical protein
VVGPLLAAHALLLRCAASAMLSSLHWLIAVREALLLFDPRTLRRDRPLPPYQVRSSRKRFRTTVTPVALENCNLWLRIDVCVGIVVSDQHAVCRYVVSRSLCLHPHC